MRGLAIFGLAALVGLWLAFRGPDPERPAGADARQELLNGSADDFDRRVGAMGPEAGQAANPSPSIGPGGHSPPPPAPSTAEVWSAPAQFAPPE